MAKNLQTKFSTRQYMLSRDFEIYYYNEPASEKVSIHSHDYYEFYFFPGRMSPSGSRGAVSFKIWRYGADTSGDKAHGDGAWK